MSSRSAQPRAPEWLNSDLAKILSHPLRVKILGELNLRAISPNEFRLKYELPLSNVSYHFRELEKAGCIEVVRERQVRGSVEHFFAARRRVLFDAAAWEDLPDALRRGVSGRVLNSILTAASAALAGNTFDRRPDRHLTWDQEDLDEQGWEELQGILLEAYDRACQARDDARERIADGAEPSVRTTWALLGFESPPLD